jgi:opacity protein-like surface antigen
LRTILLATAIVALLAGTAAAQDDARDWNQAYDPYVGGLGLGVGASSGSGLAIRWPALPQTMFTVTGAGWGKSGEIEWNLGLEAHYILRQAGRSRLFTGPSVAYYQLDGIKDWNFGAGVGVEYLAWSRWAFKVDLSFTWLSGEEAVYLLPQAGLIFYW